MKLKLLSILLLGQAVTALQAQTLYVKPQTGNQTAYSLSTIKKMTFANGNLVISSTAGANDIIALSANPKLSFSLTLKTLTNALPTNNFYLFLNPLTAFLSISNPTTTELISDFAVIGLDGKIFKTQKQLNKNEATISVADLPSGIYLCRINSNQNPQTSKFIKK